ncbi:50S ribosomal protein L29 [Mycoplasmopsis pullorum]|uniref:Large ribosomal subunit protein uL29 n=1 Tax=Mycoplasmopsis pullorum TaxID=48003 RepID=A0A1L4FS25_9BACT|nr:50S ribosomal protein L29 [Mycoplasmopsis pullorum]APJ38411.1 50S ribosomal protein L29 [Mycoplasmopsis pullorum]TNK82049.1 50S ribosomal protein L29 [Mycoplasmopsis pullorum]TNK82738.1 50S ribosomal protein L29 [Mycoplasmopsis pullorum]TNK84840.1 50S ribosomal protein L29 [Mycoplasmopsis pullorum]TNK85801.1 50S ribosomal protein L29 [Mycoplasmopsis pullorum]
MLYKDIKEKSTEELQKLVNDLKAELWTLRFKNATGSLDQTHKIKLIRKDIAKVLTALNEKGAK